jgi:DNA-binding NarL/FixJ family response regulator
VAVSVLIVDDDALVRAGLRMILAAAGDITVVDEAGDGAPAVDAARRHRPDVVLMDIRMPGTDGISATAALRALPDPPEVIVLTTFHLDDYVLGALRAGASGFLLKDTPPAEIARAVRLVAAGDAMLSPAVTRTLIAHLDQGGAGGGRQRRAGALRRLAGLTDREREVAVAVAGGSSNAEIGARLFMSEATVKAHVSRLLAKLPAANRVQVAMIVHDAGLV